MNLAFVATKVVIPMWSPARRFWNVFQIHDPGSVSPFCFRSEKTAEQYEACYRKVRDARPANRIELGEKLKIASAIGLCQMMRCLPPESSDRAECIDLLRKELIAVLSFDPELFIDVMRREMLSEQLTFEPGKKISPAESLATKFSHYISFAGEIWSSRLCADFEALDLIGEGQLNRDGR
jgi:hypothetical protein